MEDDNTIWAGTQGGLAKYDGSYWTFYTENNSGLPCNYVHAIAIDEAGRKWIATDWGGVAVFDDYEWTVYNTSNSDLHNNQVISIAIDLDGTKWIGTTIGLASFDDAIWEIFIFEGLARNAIEDIAIDTNNVVWLATSDGLGSYDGSEWTWFDTRNSGLPFDCLMSVSYTHLTLPTN